MSMGSLYAWALIHCQHQRRNRDTADKIKAEGEEAKVEVLIGTRKAVGAFLAHRSDEGYSEVLRAFVFESMETERCAFFPTSTEIAVKFLGGEGSFSSALARDANGRPYLAFLTTQDREDNGAGACLSMKASEMLIHVMTDQELAGVALDPWNGGGVAFPKNLLWEEMRRPNDSTATEDSNKEAE